MSIEVLRLMFQHTDLEVDGRMLPTGLPASISEEEFQSIWNQARHPDLRPKSISARIHPQVERETGPAH